MTAAIVGLGLIGGSLGLALKETGMFKEIVGFDMDTMHSQQAIALGLVDELVEAREVMEADVIFLAIPVDGIIGFLKEIATLPSHATIIDMGSTKARIVANIPASIRKNCIAAHPMSGTEHFGPKAARADLFSGKIVVLTDLQESGEYQCSLAKEVFIALNMQIVKMDSNEHDRHAAFISHMPHLISYALANSVLAQEDPESILLLAAGGFRDMSRIAKSSPRMWSEISKQNSSYLKESISYFKEELDIAYRLIEEERWEELERWMQKAVSLHDIL